MPNQELANTRPGQDLTGKVVGRFVIRARLGAGGMGEVYLADDTKLKRIVALKRVVPHLRTDQNFRHRFLKEAQRASSLSDQHIAQIYDVFEENDEVFLVMEYVEGVTLRQTPKTPLSTPEFLDIAIQCTQALAEAHAKGILHCDIKPENIVLTPTGKVKVLDFGVARRVPSADETTTNAVLTPPGVLLGTPAYMAPEVLLGKAADARADIFSLGVVFYETLTRRHPFVADGTTAAAPVPLTKLNTQVPKELERIVNKMLARDPADRYASANELLLDLRAVPGVGAEASERQIPLTRSWSLRPLLYPATALGLLTALIAAPIARHTVERFAWTVHDWMWPTSTFAERGRVLVADFENRTGDSFFDSTVSEMLTLALEESRHLAVFPRSRTLETLRRMRRPQVTRLDRATAREICVREDLTTLISGEVMPAANSYQIVVRAADPQTDTPKAVLTESFRKKEDLWRVIDHFSAQLRRALGEKRSLITQNSKPLERVTTRSLEALEHFSHALELQSEGNIEDARMLFKTAVELDPEFAMAHGRLAIAAIALGEEEEALASASHAYHLRERVSERERYLIEGFYYFLRRQYKEAAASFRTLTVLYPEDTSAYHYLSQVYAAEGKLGEAIDMSRQALKLHPRGLLEQGLLAVFLTEANRSDEALKTVQAARAQGLVGTYLYWGEGLAWLVNGEVARAREAFRALAQGGGTYDDAGRLYLAQTLIYEGELGAATEQLETDLGLDLKTRNEIRSTTRHYWLARLYLLQGRRKLALSHLRPLAEKQPLPTHLRDLRVAGLVYIEMGERSSAEQILHQLEEVRTKFPSTFSQGVASQVSGEIEWVAGRQEAARQDLQRARALLGDTLVIWSLARYWDARGDCRQAVGLYEECLARKGEMLRFEFSGLWVLAHLSAARCQRKLGNYKEAARHYDEFLRLWGAGASDLSLVREARRERQRLLPRP